jgi:hypothetical protein
MSIIAYSFRLGPSHLKSCGCLYDDNEYNRHYTLELINARCCCGLLYFGSIPTAYTYCVRTDELHMPSARFISCHSKCHDPAIIEACNRYIIDKQWIVYCKLWYLIDVHITHDIARHITLLRLQDKIIKSTTINNKKTTTDLI